MYTHQYKCVGLSVNKFTPKSKSYKFGRVNVLFAYSQLTIKYVAKQLNEHWSIKRIEILIEMCAPFKKIANSARVPLLST